MVDKQPSLEVIAPTVEEAIEKGLDDLGLTEDLVEVEVLDEGNRGLFGIGSRQARIRLTVKPTQPEGQTVLKHADASHQVRESTPYESVQPEPVPEPAPEDADFILITAQETVGELLENMHIKAKVTAEYGEADEIRNRVPVLVNVTGDDLSVLIGRRAETLNALQYIASLIVSKEVGQSMPLIVDVEGYRQRRANQLRHLARRMADQAIKSGRRQVLEPMPASERRLIHIELRDNPQVETESVGEEPRRKVTIIPK
jgi:spoIIIJ-associated protein